MNRWPTLQVSLAHKTWSVGCRDLNHRATRQGVCLFLIPFPDLTIHFIHFHTKCLYSKENIWTFINFVLYVSLNTALCFCGYLLMIDLKRAEETADCVL